MSFHIMFRNHRTGAITGQVANDLTEKKNPNYGNSNEAPPNALWPLAPVVYA